MAAAGLPAAAPALRREAVIAQNEEKLEMEGELTATSGSTRRTGRSVTRRLVARALQRRGRTAASAAVVNLHFSRTAGELTGELEINSLQIESF